MFKIHLNYLPILLYGRIKVRKMFSFLFFRMQNGFTLEPGIFFSALFDECSILQYKWYHSSQCWNYTWIYLPFCYRNVCKWLLLDESNISCRRILERRNFWWLCWHIFKLFRYATKNVQFSDKRQDFLNISTTGFHILFYNSETYAN